YRPPHISGANKFCLLAPRGAITPPYPRCSSLEAVIRRTDNHCLPVSRYRHGEALLSAVRANCARANEFIALLSPCISISRPNPRGTRTGAIVVATDNYCIPIGRDANGKALLREPPLRTSRRVRGC